jgi:hypothetical protein
MCITFFDTLNENSNFTWVLTRGRKVILFRTHFFGPEFLYLFLDLQKLKSSYLVIIFTQKSIDTVKTGYQLRRRKEWKTIDRKVKRALYKNVDFRNWETIGTKK